MKVFDGFMFYNETEMALLRMHILKDAVDYHVVVESRMTHSGQPKPLYFWEAFEAGVFDEFKDKIIYSCVSDLEGDHSWDREKFHRAHIGKVLQYNAAPEDWVIISDCDEIPNPDGVKVLKEQRVDRPVLFELDFFYYDFNHRVDMGWAIGACRWEVEQDANKIRRGAFPAPTGVNTCHIKGWHLSYFLSPEGVVDKLDAFMHHADEAAHVPRDPQWIAEKMQAGQDIFGRNIQIERVPLAQTLPAYVLAHQERYEALGWLTPEVVTL